MQTASILGEGGGLMRDELTISQEHYDELVRKYNEYFERAIRAETEAKILREWNAELRRLLFGEQDRRTD